MIDISKAAVDVAANVLRLRDAHHIALMLTALRVALDEAEARAVKAEAEVEKLLGAQRRIQNLPDEIEQQVQITRAYAADSGMDRSQLTCMEICTSHFISHARTLRAHLGAKP